MSGFVVVIPSRYASTRLPGKPLREINGKPMLEHVFRRACESKARQVVIATDDERIAVAAEGFGASVCMTGDQHESGTERIAEVCDLMDWGDDRIVVNLQGDEPTMPAALIDQCAALLADGSADIATLASPIASEQATPFTSAVRQSRTLAIESARRRRWPQRCITTVSTRIAAAFCGGLSMQPRQGSRGASSWSSCAHCRLA